MNQENHITELAGCLIFREGKLFLLYREDESHWEVPGGKVEKSESPTQAAVRETKEEAGVEVELKKPFYSGEFQKDGEMFLWHGYIAEVKQGEPCTSEDRFTDSDWFGAEELDEEDIAQNLEMVEPALRKVLD